MVKANSTIAKCARKISPENVLSKIRDDGDFDRLRLKIIRQLKDDGELRDKIIDMVKQSAVLNQPGAETMKPRQLSDAIHQEIGENVMGQISNGLWNVISSPDGMKQEVTETVQLVYNKLTNPDGVGETSALINSVMVHKGHDNTSNKCPEAYSKDGTLSNCDPNEPPGFCKSVENGEHKVTQTTEMRAVRGSRGEHSQDKSRRAGASEPDGIRNRAPHGIPESIESKQLDYGSDDELDMPPGFC